MIEYKEYQLSNLPSLINSIKDENKRQIVKWGVQAHTLHKWNTILSEEVGELSKAFLGEGSIHKEAIQVATLALKIAEIDIMSLKPLTQVSPSEKSDNSDFKAHKSSPKDFSIEDVKMIIFNAQINDKEALRVLRRKLI